MSAPALWTAAEADAATGGASSRDWAATGVSIDSRSLERGDLFIALRGPVFDGHEFVPDALGRGAAAAMISHDVAEAPEEAPLLIVADTMHGLTALAARARKRTNARIVAVTGSVGKTGTKEALRLVLERQGPTTASQSSLNNHWGVPLSLSRMAADARFGVFEIGMNHPGEITPLTKLVRPHVAIITTVASAHTEFFDSVEQIADAKAEILLGLTEDGVAVLNRDNPYFDRLSNHAKEAGVGRIVSFGTDQKADMRVLDATPGAGGTDVRAEIEGRPIVYTVGSPGRHWVMNSLAVLAAASALGADVDKAAAALADLKPLAGRGQTHRLAVGDGAFVLVDESYNANPESMRAAIATLAEMPVGDGGRRIAVLGEMRELGEGSAEMHAELSDVLVGHGIDLVFVAGAEMAHLGAALPKARAAGSAETGADLVDQVKAALRPGDVVMVKGSNASGMKAVVDALIAEAPAAQQEAKA